VVAFHTKDQLENQAKSISCERIEAWILEQTGVSFEAAAAPSGLRVVA